MLQLLTLGKEPQYLLDRSITCNGMNVTFIENRRKIWTMEMLEGVILSSKVTGRGLVAPKQHGATSIASNK
jgi:hypothetical protein